MTDPQMTQPSDILLVEDNPGDVRLAQEGMKESGIHSNLWVAADGEQALAFLQRSGEYQTAPCPDLILLDLNLPRKNGREVLAEIKADPDLRRVPVVVLSMSKAEEDIRCAYDLHANCYVTKPIDLDRFIEVMRGIQAFWLGIAQLPRDHVHGI